MQGKFCRGKLNVAYDNSNLELCHLILEHMNEKRLQILARKELLTHIKGKSFEPCIDCLASKQHRTRLVTTYIQFLQLLTAAYSFLQLIATSYSEIKQDHRVAFHKNVRPTGRKHILDLVHSDCMPCDWKAAWQDVVLCYFYKWPLKEDLGIFVENKRTNYLKCSRSFTPR